ASTYLVMAAISAHSFSQPLNHTDALYFTVTVFATVGFGDITATTTAARLVVTGQMIIDLIILGVGARVILGAVSRVRQRQASGRHECHRRPGWSGPDSQVKPGADPGGQLADRVVCLRGPAGRHLEGVQHAGEDVEPRVDARLPGVLIEQAGVVE